MLAAWPPSRIDPPLLVRTEPAGEARVRGGRVRELCFSGGGLELWDVLGEWLAGVTLRENLGGHHGG